MDLSGIATLGIFLILSFVMPGFCFVLLFGLSFPDGLGGLNVRESSGFLITALGIVGGLLFTSVCFAIELVLRWLIPNRFGRLFPDIASHRIDQIEGAGRGSLYAHMISGSAFMHFNIGIGTLIILVMSLLWGNGFGNMWRISILLVIIAAANLVVASKEYCRAKESIDGAIDALGK